jgi:hypothetical protein
MILQYLNEEGFNSSRITLHDEANVKAVEWEEQNSDARKIKKAILGTNPKLFICLGFCLYNLCLCEGTSRRRLVRSGQVVSKVFYAQSKESPIRRLQTTIP